ncbi:MAG: hypothetical protein JST16_17335 [Bdellovibrionales bacterium]|nr:hypothetical protein [Bdellovibrionales bacterium]
MRKASKLTLVSYLVGAGLWLVPIFVLADEGSFSLPVKEIILSIDEMEDATHSAALPEEVMEPVVGEGVVWDPYAAPESVLSHIMLDLPAGTYEQIEANKDQDGRPLFK